MPHPRRLLITTVLLAQACTSTPNETDLTERDTGPSQTEDSEGTNDTEETETEDSSTETEEPDTEDSEADDDPPPPSDVDGDGYSTADGDCDDADATRHPTAGDTFGDGKDSDCDGLDCNAQLRDGRYIAACVTNTPHSYESAAAACRDASFVGLAKITSAADDTFIQNLRPIKTGLSKGKYWIGLRTTSIGGTWKWEDGTTATYTNWSPGNPSYTHLGQNEFCTVIYPSDLPAETGPNQWNDVYCTVNGSENQSFVCEGRFTGTDADSDGYVAAASGGTDCNDANATIHPGAGDTYGDGMDQDCDGMDCTAGSTGGTYFAACVTTTAQSQDSARAKCTDAGYDGLASIRSNTENSYVLGLRPVTTGLTQGKYRIGLTTTAVGGTWRWEDGTEATYTNWSPGNPSYTHLGQNEFCTVIYPSDLPASTGPNQWNDAYCSAYGTENQSFVCEKR